MSDIAESLRACTENGADPAILFGAADEIDKLRAENASLKEAISLSEDSRLMDEYLKLERANARQAERIAELEEDIKESDAIRERCAYLLAETAVALKGPEKALHRHGWYDLPKVAQEQTTTIAAQSAVIDMAKTALDEVKSLIEESRGVYGLHLNGDESPWSELEQGGRFERLGALPDALAAINALPEVAEKKASE